MLKNICSVEQDDDRDTHDVSQVSQTKVTIHHCFFTIWTITTLTLTSILSEVFLPKMKIYNFYSIDDYDTNSNLIFFRCLLS